MEFLDVFNAVAKTCKAIERDYTPAKTNDDVINEDTLDLDSLDETLTYATLGDIYGVDQTLEDQWPTGTVGELRQFIIDNKTSDPTGDFETAEELARAFK